MSGEQVKADRLLSELMLLQGHGRLSTREIAERLEISTRTAHRDMEALNASGVPIVAYRGAQGGWELEKSWRTQVPGLDDAELRGLIMTQSTSLGRGKLAAAAQRAFDKFIASLPASARSQAESIRARLHFDPAGWHMDAEDLSMLPIVQEALAQDRKLSFSLHHGQRRIVAAHRRSVRHRLQAVIVVPRRAHGKRHAHLPRFAHARSGRAGAQLQPARAFRSCRALEALDSRSLRTQRAIRRDT